MMIETFEVNFKDINMIKRMDYNFWTHRQEYNDQITFKSLAQCVGKENITTSAFYPAITPFYKKIEDSDNSTLPFIRVADVRRWMLDYTETVFLDEELLNSLERNIKRVRPGDIVITKGGEYIAEATIVPTYYDDYAICRDVLALRMGNSELSGEYLASYFQSELGKSDLLRTKSVQGQPHLTLDKLYDLQIPILNNDFEDEIVDCWNSFFALINESNNNIATAQQMLNEALYGKLSEASNNFKFEKVIDTSKFVQRFDVEFYEEKWSRLVKELESMGVEFTPIKYIKEDIEREEPQKKYVYITISDIDDRSGMIKNYNEVEVFSLPDRAKRKTQLGDVLVSSLKGSKSKIAIVDLENDNIVASTGFYIVRDVEYNPEVLYLIFRSQFYNLFIEQMSSGAIMSSITDKYFKQFKVPKLNIEIQNKIVSEIQDYFQKRNNAFEYLNNAISKFDIELANNIMQ